MGKLGMKMTKAFSKLGQKVDKITTKIGDKTSHVVSEVKGVSGVLKKKAEQIGNTATNAFDKAKDLVNKIPDINEKAIALTSKVIQKSGGITNVLRKASAIGDKLIGGAAQLGGDIPGIGSALKVAARGTHQLSVGANKLDNARDIGAKKLDKYANVSRETIGEVEKINSRKKQEIADAQAQANNSGADGFA